MILFPFNSRKITQNIDDIPPHFKHRTECVCELVTRIYTVSHLASKCIIWSEIFHDIFASVYIKM